jgi:hypothetical protein
MYICTGCGNKAVFKEFTTMSRLLIYDKKTGKRTHVGNEKIAETYIKCSFCDEDSFSKVLVNRDADEIRISLH